MRICWDNIEDVRYNKKLNRFYKKYLNKKGKKQIVYYNIKTCPLCNEEYLSHYYRGSIYCSNKCKCIMLKRIKRNKHLPIDGKYLCLECRIYKEPEEFANNKQKLEVHLDSLIKHQTSSTLRINRILRIYEKNIIYLIKPNQLRYWLKSIAIRDADETVADFIEQGF